MQQDKCNSPSRTWSETPGGERKRHSALSPALPPRPFPFWHVKLAVEAGRENCPPKSSVDSDTQSPWQTIPAWSQISPRWQVLANAILGSTSSFLPHTEEVGNVPLSSRGQRMEPGVTLPALSGKNVVWASDRELLARLPACGDMCVASPSGSGWGPEGHLGAGKAGVG